MEQQSKFNVGDNVLIYKEIVGFRKQRIFGTIRETNGSVHHTVETVDGHTVICVEGGDWIQTAWDTPAEQQLLITLGDRLDYTEHALEQEQRKTFLLMKQNQEEEARWEERLTNIERAYDNSQGEIRCLKRRQENGPCSKCSKKQKEEVY